MTVVSHLCKYGQHPNGIDPSGIPYTVSKMRDHLFKGLENQNITVFPHRKLSVVLHYRLYLRSVFPVVINGWVRRPPNGPNKYIYIFFFLHFYHYGRWERGLGSRKASLISYTPPPLPPPPPHTHTYTRAPSKSLLTVPRRYFHCVTFC